MPQQSPFEPGEIVTRDGVRVLPREGTQPAGEQPAAPLPLVLLGLAAVPVLAAAAAGLTALAVVSTASEMARRLLRPWPTRIDRAAGGPTTFTATWTQVDLRWTFDR